MENKENMNTDNKPHGETNTEKAIMKENKVNEELARKEGYVPINEIDEVFDPTKNEEMKKIIDEEYEQIEQATKNYLKVKLNREVVVVDMKAIYPYSAILIKYHTLEKPIISTYINLDIGENKYFNESNFYGYNEDSIKFELVNGIIRYAYEKDINKMNYFVEKNFPEFYIDKKNSELVSTDGKNSFVNIGTADNYAKTQEEASIFIEKIYKLYLEKPNRTADEWYEIFSEINLFFNISISVNLKNKQDLPTETRIKKLSEKFKTIPKLLPGDYHFTMKTSWVSIKQYHPLETLNNPKYDFKITGGKD